MTLAAIGDLEPGGERPAEVVEVRLHERRDDHGSMGEDRLDVLEGHVADHVRLDELAGLGQSHAELPGRSTGQLLHPSHPQPQRLPEDPVVVPALRVGAEVHRVGLGRELGTRGRPVGR